MDQQSYSHQLDSYNFSTATGFNGVLVKLRYQELAHYYQGTSCLELGCADGEGTKLLVNHFECVVAVDGSKKQIERAKINLPNDKVTFINSLFENLTAREQFDTVILAHILEHVTDPLAVLATAKKYTSPNGVIIIDVPNAYSLHRQAGVLMGLLADEHELNEADRSIGHQRVYDFDALTNHISQAGLTVIERGGVFLKPFSNTQMARYLDDQAVMAFNELGKRYPELAAEIYCICKVT
jgi:2-polyprenyl-3-methyl-5-hydroxy-6-metoxy-1,4-benzoquinol methylase